MTSNYIVGVAKVSINNVDVTGVMYVADKLVGSGSGGDLVTPRTVANTVQPVGVIQHHAWCELEVCIDEDEKAAIYDAGILVPATALSGLVVTQKGADGKTRTITYSGAYVKNVGGIKVENEAEHQPYTITFLVTGTRVISTWA